jgi:hypothetical protein
MGNCGGAGRFVSFNTAFFASNCNSLLRDSDSHNAQSWRMGKLQQWLDDHFCGGWVLAVAYDIRRGFARLYRCCKPFACSLQLTHNGLMRGQVVVQWLVVARRVCIVTIHDIATFVVYTPAAFSIATREV